MLKPRQSRRLRSRVVVLVAAAAIVIAIGASGIFDSVTSGVRSLASDSFTSIGSEIDHITGPTAAVRLQNQKLLQEIHQLVMKEPTHSKR